MDGPAGSPTRTPSTGVFTLYRFYTDDDTLLYIGLSVDPGRRLREHATEKPWWATVARIEMEQHPSLEALRLAERQAIESEQPLHNIAFNDRPAEVSNTDKRCTLEWFGWQCISDAGPGMFVMPSRPSAVYTRAAAWTQIQR